MGQRSPESGGLQVGISGPGARGDHCTGEGPGGWAGEVGFSRREKSCLSVDGEDLKEGCWALPSLCARSSPNPKGANAGDILEPRELPGTQETTPRLAGHVSHASRHWAAAGSHRQGWAGVTGGTELGRAAALETTVRGIDSGVSLGPSSALRHGKTPHVPPPSTAAVTPVSGGTESLGCFGPTATLRSPDRGLMPLKL